MSRSRGDDSAEHDVTSTAPCPACGSTLVERVMTTSEAMFGTGEDFDYAECGECRTLRLLDVPNDMSRYYPHDYYSLDIDPEAVLGSGPARWLARRTADSYLQGRGVIARTASAMFPLRQYRTLVSLLRSISVAGCPTSGIPRVLDVGCGAGTLVFALGLAGWEAFGIDPYAPADRDFATGGTLRRMELQDADGPFDLVMLHHSLEHVHDPLRTLGLSRDLLTENGRILVRMPTPSSRAFEHYGSSWVQLDAPRHLTLLTREGVQHLATRAGLRIVCTFDDSTSFQYWGSEQVLRGIPLTSAESHMMDPRRSKFSARQVRRWERKARRLNAQQNGDQSIWILERA